MGVFLKNVRQSVCSVCRHQCEAISLPKSFSARETNDCTAERSVRSGVGIEAKPSWRCGSRDAAAFADPFEMASVLPSAYSNEVEGWRQAALLPGQDSE